MLGLALIALAAGSNSGGDELIERRQIDPARAQRALGSARWLRGAMAARICEEYSRKAELSRLNAELGRLSRLLERDYHLQPDNGIIVIEDRGACDEYDRYHSLSRQLRVQLQTARAALGLEN
jgi:hypothetical protein